MWWGWHAPALRALTESSPPASVLDGQHAGYLKAQLHLFAEGKRGGTPYAHLMEKTAKLLEAEDIEDLAAYLSSPE